MPIFAIFAVLAQPFLTFANLNPCGPYLTPDPKATEWIQSVCNDRCLEFASLVKPGRSRPKPAAMIGVTLAELSELHENGKVVFPFARKFQDIKSFLDLDAALLDAEFTAAEASGFMKVLLALNYHHIPLKSDDVFLEILRTLVKEIYTNSWWRSIPHKNNLVTVDFSDLKHAVESLEIQKIFEVNRIDVETNFNPNEPKPAEISALHFMQLQWLARRFDYSAGDFLTLFTDVLPYSQGFVLELKSVSQTQALANGVSSVSLRDVSGIVPISPKALLTLRSINPLYAEE